MAALNPTARGQSGVYAEVRNTLTAADTFVYDATKSQSLHLFNSTASPVNVLLKGNTATTVNAAGVGSVDVSAGKTIAVPATSSVGVTLASIGAYLSGTSVAVTGGVGVTAVLYQ